MTSTPCTEINLTSVNTANPLDLNLQRQAMVSIPDVASRRISCIEGAIWVTLDHSIVDVVLEPGDVFTTSGHQRAVIYALKASRISVASTVVARKPEIRRQPVFNWKPRLPLAFSAVWA